MSGLMTSRDAARLAADHLSLLPQQAVVLRPSAESDGQGGQGISWENVGTYPCRMGPLRMSEAERMVGERFYDREAYRVGFVADTDIRITDRLEIDGLTFSVESVRHPHGVEVERVAIVTRAAV